MPDPADPIETWLLHRVAEAVEGNEVSATLLTDLHAAIAEVRARSPNPRAGCLRHIVEGGLTDP